MTFKKRTIICLCTISATLVFALISVIAVFAVSNIKVKTNMSVTYTSNVVGATYSLRYRDAVVGYTYIDEGVDISSAGEDPVVTTSQIGNEQTELGSSNNYGIWCWSFKNTGANAFNLTLNYEDADNRDRGINIAVLRNTRSDATSSNINTAVSLGSQTYFNSESLQPGSTAYFYVKIVLDANSQYAEMSGTFNWTLTTVEPTVPEQTPTE